MSKLNVQEKSKKSGNAWDIAIADAKKRIQDFKKAIKTYTAAKKRGESWPTENSAT